MYIIFYNTFIFHTSVIIDIVYDNTDIPTVLYKKCYGVSLTSMGVGFVCKVWYIILYCIIFIYLTYHVPCKSCLRLTNERISQYRKFVFGVSNFEYSEF